MLVRVLTPSVSPNEKTFKVVLVCCSRDPSPHPPSIFGGFSGSFASVCSHPSGVPVTSLLFLASFEHLLHLFVFGSSRHSLFYTTLFTQKLQCNPALSCSKAGHWKSMITYLPTHTACSDRPPADSHPWEDQGWIHIPVISLSLNWVLQVLQECL